jgi:hypothetical protein
MKELVSQCPPLDEKLRQTGHLLAQAALGSTRTVIRPRDGQISVTNGPFIETNEQVGGFFMIEANDLDEAIRIASNHPAAHLGEHVGWGIELIPLHGYQEFL